MNIVLLATSIVAAYVALVLIAETLIWRIQPSMDGGVTLFIKNNGEEQIERTVYGYKHEGTLYVSSNHWFRSWYHAALKNPDINVLREDSAEPQRYIVRAVVGDEHSNVAEGYNMGFLLRFLCGFAPSKLLRLEPAA